MKDKIAKITAGAHKLDAGAASCRPVQRLQDGAGQLHAGTGKLTAGFETLARKLNSQEPDSPGWFWVHAPDGRDTKLRAGMDGVPGDPDRPGCSRRRPHDCGQPPAG